MTKSKQTPKIAIITRTKNRNVLLERTINSVQSQTFRNYLHVILNDGGDKNDLEALLARYPDDNRVVIHNTASVGLTKALNQAIRSVDSDYICILDDDDSWPADRLANVTGFFEENPTTAAVVVKMDIVIEDFVDGKPVKRDQYLHPDSGDGEINLFKQCMRNYISNGIVTYKRSVYDELNGYDDTLVTAEDWDFGLRLLLKYDVEYLQTDESLFFYHQRPELVDSNGNSVHAGVRHQEVTVNKLRNKYLRDDLINGKLGVGYIMNQSVQDINNVVRIEGHVNRTADIITSEVDGYIHQSVREIQDGALLSKLKRKILSALKK